MQPYPFLTKNILPGEIEVDRAQGAYFWDMHGNKYLDFIAQTNNLNFGNCPPHLKEALLQQSDRYTHVTSRIRSDVFINLCRKLVSIAPPPLTKVNAKLTNGGDAVESAIKRARVYRGKPNVLSFYQSHHGESCETLRMNGKRCTGRTMLLGGSDHVIHVPPPFLLKEQGQLSDSAADDAALNILHTHAEQRKDVAAVLLEPVMVATGCHIFSQRFLEDVRELCDDKNISLIYDEVQTAFGWTGGMFAADHYKVSPDLMSLGKGIAAGMPMAAVLLREEYDVLDYGEDEYTSGGNPLSCAVAERTIDVLTAPGFLETVRQRSAVLAAMLRALHEKCRNIITADRCLGMMGAFDFHPDHPAAAAAVQKSALEKRLLTRIAANDRNTIIVKPPLIVTDDDIHEAGEILAASVVDYQQHHA